MGDRLEGKVAIVTGAGSVAGPPDRPSIGNGKATAAVFAREGASIMAVDIKLEAVEETKRMIEKEGGVCSVLQADVSRSKDCYDMAEHCIKIYGRIDILHNNVGINRPGSILEVREDDWNMVMDVNLKSMFHTSRAVLPQMIKQRNGVILNISSVGAILPERRELFLYNVSKAGVNALTRCLAADLADKGVRVNGIMPGIIDTPMRYQGLKAMGVIPEQVREVHLRKTPMKRLGEPWDVAYASLFLASDEANYITGVLLLVDGGLVLTGGV